MKVVRKQFIRFYSKIGLGVAALGIVGIILLSASVVFQVGQAIVPSDDSSIKPEVREFVLSTGAAGETYSEVGALIEEGLRSQWRNEDTAPQFRLRVVDSEGSRENLTRLTIDQNTEDFADLAIIQSDLIERYRRGDFDEGMKIASPDIMEVLPLYWEMVTLVVSPEIENINMLSNGRVGVAKKGSGSYFNAKDILDAGEIACTRVPYQNIEEAFKMLESGEIDGFFRTIKHPSPLIEDRFRRVSGDVATYGRDENSSNASWFRLLSLADNLKLRTSLFKGSYQGLYNVVPYPKDLGYSEAIKGSRTTFGVAAILCASGRPNLRANDVNSLLRSYYQTYNITAREEFAPLRQFSKKVLLYQWTGGRIEPDLHSSNGIRWHNGAKQFASEALWWKKYFYRQGSASPRLPSPTSNEQ